jgi:mannosyltransferase
MIDASQRNDNEPGAALERRLLLDSTIFDLQPDGGISRYWYELVSNLAARYADWDITLYADPNTRNQVGRKLIDATKDRPKVRLHSYSPTQLGRFFGPRLRGDHPRSVWHSSYYRVPTGRAIASVCTVHDFTYERYFSGAFAWMHNLKKRRAILQAKQLICVSEATRRDLLGRFPQIDVSRCHVIHHGLSGPFTSKLAPRLRPSVGPPYVLFVGSRVSYKNFPLVVRAIEVIPDHELVIVGGGKLSQDELTMLRQHLPERHRILEAPNDETLRRLYEEATALAYPSRWEGFGLPLLEAMACGCPVIAMNMSSIPEVVGDAGLLLSTEDVGEMAEAIRATTQSECRAGMIERGLKRAAQFSWDRTVDKTVAVYEKALG